MERLEFKLPHVFDWSRCFHPESLELCLNWVGRGAVRCARSTVDFGPLTAGFYVSGKRGLAAWREAGQRHRFITLRFSREFLRLRLGACDGALHPLVETFVRSDAPRGGVAEVRPLTTGQGQRLELLLAPPVPQGARALWYEGQALGLMAEFFFERRGEDELFCSRQKRLARERVEQVRALLERHLAEPLSLEEIGRHVGCSPFYLSRTFSAEMGMTIPQYLRKVRLERAAELLRTGEYNVTEAALEVGYSSLSHFSQAFCQTMGCCPALYPLRAPGRGAPGR